jgi:hypothetical protein
LVAVWAARWVARSQKVSKQQAREIGTGLGRYEATRPARRSRCAEGYSSGRGPGGKRPQGGEGGVSGGAVVEEATAVVRQSDEVRCPM